MNEHDQTSAFELRDYRPNDTMALAEVYRSAVQITGALAYTPEQVAAWSRFADDIAAFDKFLAEGWIRIAHDDLGSVGFGQLNAPGHIALLYTAPRLARQGVASAILDDLAALGEAMGAKKLTIDASRIARPLFLKHGFVEIAVENVEHNGVLFERFRMEARL